MLSIARYMVDIQGIEGIYITADQDFVPEDQAALLKGIHFHPSQHMGSLLLRLRLHVSRPFQDHSLRDFSRRILPIATYYTAISAFIEMRSHLEYGLVNHALCAAMRDMLKEYNILISQLEHAHNATPGFTLQKLWFYVQPTLHTLSLLYALLGELVEPSPSSGSEPTDDDDDDYEDAAANEALGLAAGLKAVISQLDGAPSGGPVKGGEVLAILHGRMTMLAGDPAAYALHRALLARAARPYVEVLERWTRSGQLDDPHEELMVKEAKFINRGMLDMDYTDEYWERRYTVRDVAHRSRRGRGS